MASFKIHKNENYTIISNHHLRNKELSLKAKGLLSIMLSLPKDWDYSISGLIAICKEQESAITSTLAELKNNGYLIIKKFMPNETKSGRIEYEYHIFENPEQEKQEYKKQALENQWLEKQDLENPIQYNINNKRNNNINIYNNIINYLNSSCSKHYKSNIAKTKKLIDARIKEGFTEDDFKKVIDNKKAQWLKDEKMNQYLRPETLFGTKFESYLNTETSNNNIKDDELI